jgi:hypothetical protein
MDILRSESRGTHDHILLSQIRDFPNLEGQVPVFISPRNRVARLYPQALGLNLLLQIITVITYRHGPRRKHRLQQFRYCCMRIRCQGKVFTEPFLSSGRLFLLIKICCLAANVVSLFVSRSLPRNGSIRHSLIASACR